MKALIYMDFRIFYCKRVIVSLKTPLKLRKILSKSPCCEGNRGWGGREVGGVCRRALRGFPQGWSRGRRGKQVFNLRLSSLYFAF